MYIEIHAVVRTDDGILTITIRNRGGPTKTWLKMIKNDKKIYNLKGHSLMVGKWRDRIHIADSFSWR